MKIQYFTDTDTLYIELRAGAAEEIKDLDENTLADFDGRGELCGLTVEHANERVNLGRFSFETVGQAGTADG